MNSASVNQPRITLDTIMDNLIKIATQRNTKKS